MQQYELHFLNEIQSSLYCDEPRLIYADWLNEQCDPRAQYLRDEVAFANAEIRSELALEKQSAIWKYMRGKRPVAEKEWVKIVGIRFDLVLVEQSDPCTEYWERKSKFKLVKSITGSTTKKANKILHLAPPVVIIEDVTFAKLFHKSLLKQPHSLVDSMPGFEFRRHQPDENF